MSAAATGPAVVILAAASLLVLAGLLADRETGSGDTSRESPRSGIVDPASPEATAAAVGGARPAGRSPREPSGDEAGLLADALEKSMPDPRDLLIQAAR